MEIRLAEINGYFLGTFDFYKMLKPESNDDHAIKVALECTICKYEKLPIYKKELLALVLSLTK
jgi:hypothetical protein